MLGDRFLFGGFFHAALFAGGRRGVREGLKAEFCFGRAPAAVGYLFGVLQKMRRITQSAGDIKRAAFTGFADDEPVFGAQGLAVKGHARVEDALSFLGVLFDLRVVRGGEEQTAAAAQLLQNGNGDTHALRRVGTGAELIEQHEGIPRGVVQDIDDVRDVCREGGKILRDVLPVADIAQHIAVHADLGALAGQMQAALRHHGEQAHKL